MGSIVGAALGDHDRDGHVGDPRQSLGQVHAEPPADAGGQGREDPAR